MVEIAARLFYEQGFGNTGIKQIIEEAGIAKGTFYSHFSSKEELGLAWLKERHLVWNRWLAEEIADCATAGDKILGLFDFLERWMREAGYRGCAFLNTLAETPDADCRLRKVICEHKQELQSVIQGLVLEYYQEKASKGSRDVSELARQKGSVLFLLFEGALIESQNFCETWPITVARSEVESILATPG